MVSTVSFVDVDTPVFSSSTAASFVTSYLKQTPYRPGDRVRWEDDQAHRAKMPAVTWRCEYIVIAMYDEATQGYGGESTHVPTTMVMCIQTGEISTHHANSFRQVESF